MSGCSDTFPVRFALRADNRGYSLIELLVVMGIFLTVMMITSSTFKTIVTHSSQQSKMVETQIEGIVGLEVLRADLQQAGFGLPWTFQNTIATTAYLEADMDANMPQSGFWPSGDPDLNFNDAPAGIPRAIQSGNTNFNKDSDNNGSKFIVIKATTAATNDAARKWTSVTFQDGTKSPPRVWSDPDRNLAASDRVIVVKNNLNTTPPTRQLMVNSGNFFTTFGLYSTMTMDHRDGDTFQVYGLSKGNLRMPFNRADYFIMKPTSNMPQGCAPNTGVLYKYNVSQSSGGYDPKIPLLDCVADMQIVYGLDTDGSGRVNLHTTTAPATAADQRAQIKELRVYVLAQEGKADRTFRYPSPTIDVGESFDGGATVSGRRFDLQAQIPPDNLKGIYWYNYRWKVYTIVVRPLNLIQ